MMSESFTWGNMFLFIAMIVIFYFLLIRPQQRRTRRRNAMLGGLKKKDNVITIGGIYGTIVDLTEDRVVLRVNENTRITFERNAINAIAREE